MVFGCLRITSMFYQTKIFSEHKTTQGSGKCCRAGRKNTTQGNLPGLATHLDSYFTALHTTYLASRCHVSIQTVPRTKHVKYFLVQITFLIVPVNLTEALTHPAYLGAAYQKHNAMAVH